MNLPIIILSGVLILLISKDFFWQHKNILTRIYDELF